MSSKNGQCVQPQYRNDADEPTDCEDAEDCDQLTFGYPQAPKAWNWDDSDQEIGDNIHGSIRVPHSVEFVSREATCTG